jgi:superfamily I DNA/RNA helicase
MPTASKSDFGDIYEKAKRNRSAATDEVLSSASSQRLVVAGPGTGKTFLFQQALTGKNSALTLSFINRLVESLSLELYSLSQVSTFHSYSRSLLSRLKRKDIPIHPQLTDVITEDALFVLGKVVDFKKALCELNETLPELSFYGERTKFYQCYGFSDIVLAVVRELSRDITLVPKFDLLLVDEYQDFNKLEIALIDLLASASDILFVGDDDQALY